MMTVAALPTQSAQPNLTTAQHLLWLGQKLAPASPLYNMAFLFTLSGEIEPVHFQAAFQALVERSDALRMVIEEVDGVPQRRVLPQVDYEVPILDFSDRENPQAEARTWAENRSQTLFELSKRLFDTALIRLSSDCYAWYISQHHVITDIQSVHLIYQTIGDFYHRSIAGNLSEAPTLPAYGDVSFPSPSSRAIDYWQQQQANSVDLYHRSASQVSSRTRRVSWELGPERTAALKRLAMNSDARALTPQLSLFNLVAGILLAYLHRVSSSNQVAFATPAHGRPTTLLKETIGVFIELFPLQADIEPGETFASLLRKVSHASGGMLRYAQPGASQFAPSRDVNVVLNFIHAKLSDFGGRRPVSLEWIHPGAGDPRHHLRLQVHDFDDRGSLQLHFDFNCDLFEPELQKRATGHFLALVDAVLADLHQPIAEVKIVTDLEKADLTELGKCDRIDVTQTVVQQFEEQVERTPDAVAVSCDNETLTYQQLNARANQLANYLQQQGVTSETPVGICLRRSMEMLVAIWAVLKAGGAYVPIDPSHPNERIAHILRDTQVCWVLTQSEFTVRLNSHAVNIQMDTLDLTSQPNTNLNNPSTINQLAYLLYTSGSTGKPKGVAVEHRGLANYVNWAIQQYVRGRTLAFPLFSPFTFDLTVTSIYVPLLSGGQVVIYPEGDEAIDLSLQQIFQDNAVDVIKLTPSHLALVKGMTIGSRVKTLILGGEDLKTSLAGAIANASDQPIEIYNEYGPTEATVGCMIHRFELEPDAPTSVSIGKPAAGSEIYLLDDQLNLVPQGAVGEIFIGGPGLARGYLNRPELTAERFVDRGDQRLYRTGDLGRWQENGQLTYLGRGDRQVKIHGTRIELGEIEAALVDHPGVTASAVSLGQSVVPVQAGPVTYCTRCGIASNYPGIAFDHGGVCDICQTYETYRDRTEQYFKSIDEFKSRLEAARQRKQGEYDCMMLLSGGKDSTYALAQLVTMGLKVFAFTLDNGYISEQAKDNIRRVVKTLGVDHQFGTTPAMNDIFVDSLNRHCNVCNGCFKTIYTLSMQLAYEREIPCIVTGLSRGQFFETRLTEEWFTELFGQSEFDVDQIDETILAARKAYHRTDDAVSQLMDVAVFQTDDIFERVEIIDFYRYCDVELAEMLSFLKDQVPWIRPSDTGRSTNCLINNVGIHLHTQKRGYHNYALPYSWDVRMGHKTPAAAIDELNDEIDVAEVERILQEIGYEDEQINKAQLAAYYVGHASTADLRHFLTQRLPSNLVPAYFIQLESMPLTANGKVDFSALPDPKASRPELQSEFVAPATAVEKTLAKLWQQVLKLDRIGIHDNFYELGGDSIMAIQIAARMSEAGFSLSPNQIFQHPTLAKLSAVVAPEHEYMASEDLTGTIPLTPIQQAFFEQQSPEPEQFTQTVVLDVAKMLDLTVLKSALIAVVNHHDSLRLSYTQSEAGWEQRYGEPVADVAIVEVDVSAQLHPQETITKTIAQLQTQLELTKGDLVRAVLFDLGTCQQLGLVIHHLAVDALSWLTLIQDLETAYQQLSQGEEPSLPLKTSSFKAWAHGLKEISLPQSAIDYWLSQPDSVAQLGGHPQAEATARTVSRQLSYDLTQTFLQTSRARPQEMLLTALTLAVKQHTGQSAVQVALEGHGREESIIPNMRLVRTVGWFTSLFPITLTAQSDPSETLRSVKTTLEQVPQNGIGYGILRYLRDTPVANQPQPEILFNYLGTLEQLVPPNSMFRFAQPLQVSRSPRQARSHPLDISAFIREGQLHIDWCYSGLDDSTAQALADGVIQHLQTLLEGPGNKATAADFPLAKLNSKKLDKLSALLNQADRTGGQG
ncbi:non-ribosomal peptide synthase/amino acid adenylation enzyme [Leptolyngbya sp. PCC 7375]|nr:non-ribosomal peptide synthase/amino acid adenylation enzyme [Leptolyngbya sp. PCC 7375]